MTTETKFTVGEYKTRDGRRARVYATDGGGGYPIHGAIFDKEDQVWFTHKWTGQGEWYPLRASDYDLMPPLREIWVIDGSGWNCATKEQAERERKSFYGDEYKPIIKYREVRDDQA